jgi:hypothetical protein
VPVNEGPAYKVTYINLPELKARVRRAIDILYARDSDLFSRGASEWAIAHRLAVYLEQEIPGWNVDCEYNRQGTETNLKTNEEKRKIRPDIVLHHRGRTEMQHNLLVIELKKVESAADLGKAGEYTKAPAEARTFQYQYGLALSVSGGLKLHWFKSGEEVS